MAYIALYRKWRPQDFSGLIGQEHIRKTLANAIEQGKVAHAYLFSGSRGTGKTSTAKILAKALNCEHGPTAEPCNECVCCKKINDGSFMDVFEIDAASNRGIDEIRELRETVKFAPVDGRYKVYIIDEVHMLTTEAFNALLKTLEEPPSHVVFILATTEVHKVPITIQSRCQRYDFKRITKEDIIERLKTVLTSMDIKTDDKTLELIAIQSDGGMRDALSLLDQCLAFTNDVLTIEEVKKVLGLVGNHWIWNLTDKIIAKDADNILLDLAEIIAQGKDLKQILTEFMLHLRSLMLYKATNKMLNIDLYMEEEEILQRQSKELTHEEIVELIRVVHETLNELKWATHARIAVETMFLKICWGISSSNVASSAVSSSDTSGLAQKVEAMDRIIKSMSMQLSQLQQDGMTSVGNNGAKSNVASGVNIAARPSMPATTKPVNPRPVEVSAQKAKADMTSSAPGIATTAPVVSGESFTGNIQGLWEQVRNHIARENKVVLMNMINKAYPYKTENNQFFIEVDSPFSKMRITRSMEDVKYIESLLASYSGVGMKLVVTHKGDKAVPGQVVKEVSPPAAPRRVAPVADATPKFVPPTPVETAPVTPVVNPMVEVNIPPMEPPPMDEQYFASLSEEGPEVSPDDALAKAVDIFGGEAILEEEK